MPEPTTPPPSAIVHREGDVPNDFAGFTTLAVVNDAESNLYSVLAAIRSTEGRPADAPPKQVVGVIPFKFHGARDGYLVMSYDPLADPHYVKAP